MKKIYLSLLVLTSMGATAQNWMWAKDRNTNNVNVSSRNTFRDAADNIYFLNEDKLCKYNSAGANLWSKNTIAINFMDFETDKIYTATQFTGTLTVGSNTFTPRSYYDMVVTKWDSSFTTPAWSVQFKGSIASSGDKVYPLSVKAVNGFTYVLGNFDDSLFVNSTAIAGINGLGTFIAKIDASGNVVYVSSFGYIYKSSVGEFSVEDMQLDASGNIYFAGMFGEAKIAGTFYQANHTFPFGSGQDDPFYMKLDNTGTPVYFRTFWGSQQQAETIKSLKLMGNNLVISGNYVDSLKIGTTQLIATAGSTKSGYVASLDLATGNTNWVKNSTSTKSCTAGSLVTDANNNLYLGGDYQKDMLFNGNSYAVTSASPSIFNAYLIKLDANGNTLWSNLSGDCYLNASSVLLLSNGDAVIGGNYTSPFGMSFGTNSLPGTAGYSHPFLARSGNPTSSIENHLMRNEEHVLFPNPFSQNATIHFSTPLKTATIKIFDATGKLVNEENFSGTDFNLERNNLSNGLYLYQVISQDNFSANGRFIIE